MNEPGPTRREVLASVACAAALPANHRDELRIGLIGCGRRGTAAATQALRAAGPVRLVAVGDVFADRIDTCLKSLRGDGRLRERVDVPAERRFVGFDAHDGVIASEVDVVILATPPHFRPAHFARAVDAGKHVFMEKPVAVDGKGVKAILEHGEIAKTKRLSVVVGLQRRHQNGYREAIERVHDGQIGEILAARCFWNQGFMWHKERRSSWTDMEWQLRNWLYFTWLSGDHIVEQHVHNLDVVNWAKQSYPVRASGMGGRQVRVDKTFGHVFDHHAVEFEYADDTVLFSQCRQIAGCAERIGEHLIGDRGRCDLSTGRWEIHGEDPWQYGHRDRNNPYQTEQDDLFDAVRSGTPRLEYEYGATSTLTAIMGRLASYTGKVITREQALESEWPGPDRYALDARLPEWTVPSPGRA